MKNKTLAVTACTAFLCGTTLVNNSFAEESSKKTNTYENNFFIGTSIGSLNSSSELKEPEGINFTNNIDVSNNTLFTSVNSGYKIYFSSNKSNSFFLTPEIFYNFGETQGDDVQSYGSYNIKISPTYGAKVSFGYELDNKHAFSIGLGAQNINYDYRYSSTSTNSSKSDNELVGLFSFKYEYNINKSLAMNINYDHLKFTFETPNTLYTTSGRPINEIETNVSSLSVGLAYKF
ncbi:MAG TPA: hypothetical protein VLL98_05315 [Rickettsiales bacterium]|nr:hypothetical protein [Rickettsiales bacterium]